MVFLDVLDDGLLEQVTARGDQLRRGLEALAERFPIVREVRGRGLMLGLRLHHSAQEVQKALYQEGLIVNCTAGDVLRIVPPFVLTAPQIEQGLECLAGVLARFPQEVAANG